MIVSPETAPSRAGSAGLENLKVAENDGHTMVINMGPQHPSTHGVLRVVLTLDGEYIVKAEPVIGYLHRMHEKMAENRTCLQYMPNMGRVDYLNPLGWNWAYVGALERLAGIQVPERAEFIRVITGELNRISSHLVWFGAYILDLGAFTPIMYAFEDRKGFWISCKSFRDPDSPTAFSAPAGWPPMWIPHS